jgi:EmrB/QacA subfamily drug resistance transporter
MSNKGIAVSTNTTNTTVPAGYATRWIGLIFIGIALLVISLDATVLNLALPSLSRDLNAQTSDLQWLVDAYTLVFAALLLTTGTISDRFGRKKTLILGLALFAVGSLGASASTTAAMLIGFRAFLGIAGALIMPSTLSLINATFPAIERPKAIGIWSGIFGLGIAVGPIIGGFLLKVATWHDLFLVAIPVIVIAIIGCSRFLGESRDESKPTFDLLGVVFSTISLFTLVYAIIEAGAKGWGNPEVLQLFAGGFVALAIFVVIEMRAKEPMLPLYLFKNPSFSGASLAMTLVSFSLTGSLFFLSQYMQTILGYSTLRAGFGNLPIALGLFSVAPFSATVARKIGIKQTVALGIGMAALALLFMGLNYKIDSPYIVIAIGQIILASGLGLSMAPATSSIMSAIPVNKSGVGSAMNDTTRQLGSALGVAILGTFMNSTYIAGVAALKTAIPQLPAQAYDAIAGSIQAAHIIAANPQMPDSIGKQILVIANTAFVNGMTNAMLVSSGIMGLAVVFVLIVLPTRIHVSKSEHEIVDEPTGVAIDILPATGD